MALPIMHKYRLFHAALALLAVASYASTYGLNNWHIWPGYGVAALIAGRVLWSRGRAPQLKLRRFRPDFTGFTRKNLRFHPATGRITVLLLATTLLVCAASGLALEWGEYRPWLAQVHEVSGNILPFVAGVHIAYMLTFRKYAARFMLFLSRNAG